MTLPKIFTNISGTVSKSFQIGKNKVTVDNISDGILQFSFYNSDGVLTQWKMNSDNNSIEFPSGDKMTIDNSMKKIIFSFGEQLLTIGINDQFTHIENTENPHETTAEQVGAYDKDTIDQYLLTINQAILDLQNKSKSNIFRVIVNEEMATAQSHLNIDASQRDFYMYPYGSTVELATTKNYYKWGRIAEICSNIASTEITSFVITGDLKMFEIFIPLDIYTNYPVNTDNTNLWFCGTSRANVWIHNGFSSSYTVDKINMKFTAFSLEGTAKYQQHAMYFYGCDKVTVRDCIIDISGDGCQTGISAMGIDDITNNKRGAPASSVIIENNKIKMLTTYDKSNYWQRGIDVLMTDNAIIKGNYIEINENVSPYRQSTYATRIMSWTSARVERNYIKGNMYPAIYCSNHSNYGSAYEYVVPTDLRTEFIDNYIDAVGGILYVGSNSKVSGNYIRLRKSYFSNVSTPTFYGIKIGSSSMTYGIIGNIEVSKNIILAYNDGLLLNTIVIDKSQQVLLSLNKNYTYLDDINFKGMYKSLDLLPTITAGLQNTNYFVHEYSKKRRYKPVESGGVGSGVLDGYFELTQVPQIIPSGSISLLNSASKLEIQIV